MSGDDWEVGLSLSGTPFLVTVITSAILAILAIVIWWPHLGRPGWQWWLARTGGIVGTNLLVLLTAAVVLNDQYEFYVDWTDLFSTAPVIQTQVAAGGTAAGALGSATTVATPTVTPSVVSSSSTGQYGSRITTYVVHGVASGLTGRIVIALPADYQTSGAHAYPVIEAFHGVPGDPLSYVSGALNLRDLMDRQVLAHTVRDTIIVIPQLMFPAGYDTECLNLPGTSQVETWLAVDVPAWVQQNLRATTDRSGWSTFGVSAGAYCAAMITTRHPNTFGSAIAIAGYYHPEFPSWYYESKMPALINSYDLIPLLKNTPPPVALWISTSPRDKLSYQSSEALIKATRTPTSITAIVQKKVGHRVSAWVPLVSLAYAWLGQNMPGFAPI